MYPRDSAVRLGGDDQAGRAKDGRTVCQSGRQWFGRHFGGHLVQHGHYMMSLWKTMKTAAPANAVTGIRRDRLLLVGMGLPR
jgi:hypothetical protein